MRDISPTLECLVVGPPLRAASPSTFITAPRASTSKFVQKSVLGVVREGAAERRSTRPPAPVAPGRRSARPSAPKPPKPPGGRRGSSVGQLLLQAGIQGASCVRYKQHIIVLLSKVIRFFADFTYFTYFDLNKCILFCYTRRCSSSGNTRCCRRGGLDQAAMAPLREPRACWEHLSAYWQR